MLIAQISDLHIQLGGQNEHLISAHRHLATCVDALNALLPRPDLVVATGDLTEHGKPEEYQVLKQELDRLAMPFILIAGNHDDPATLRAGFPEHHWMRDAEPFLQYTIDTWPLRIVALDTTLPRRGDGGLCDARLEWLAQTLAEQPDRPTLILMHHPPFETGIRRMDELGLLQGREAFARVIEPYRNIERILCGHLHRSIVCRVGGTVASTCPGTAHQIALDLREDARLLFNFEPPGYQLHWFGPQGLVSHQAVIGDFPGPYGL
ncbi:phosphodiesterase [Parapusillimonas granuli]|uniref:Phosphodiesterase n=1 Tax=Parapusillimonas granuli TaxID=380911 RepID=A0A853FZG6_9BURK|nr:phosphodiesterase [Parapusillimonas granuli]MBB5216484.1 3',5'-cyclic AMP phosphodiesterase CpdA [Parapusillimonas granuli]MEB2399773.1 phosphodiesterase [Alcaligenaceae bacterium]NYT48210.1 phosphodiesterase [Parapusillimonas granuli]